VPISDELFVVLKCVVATSGKFGQFREVVMKSAVRNIERAIEGHIAERWRINKALTGC
jgi:hypothetical protein